MAARTASSDHVGVGVRPLGAVRFVLFGFVGWRRRDVFLFECRKDGGARRQDEPRGSCRILRRRSPCARSARHGCGRHGARTSRRASRIHTEHHCGFRQRSRDRGSARMCCRRSRAMRFNRRAIEWPRRAIERDQSICTCSARRSSSAGGAPSSASDPFIERDQPAGNRRAPSSPSRSMAIAAASSAAPSRAASDAHIALGRWNQDHAAIALRPARRAPAPAGRPAGSRQGRDRRAAGRRR